jgi:hypothetical protein
MIKIKSKPSIDIQDIKDNIYDAGAKQLAKEIDAEVLRQVFIEAGWHEVVLRPMTWELGYTIDSWVEENIKGDRWTYGLVWLFKEEKDATWFKLRWLSQ